MTTLSPIERLKLVQALRTERANLDAATTPIAKLRVVKAIREIRTKLGLGLAKETQPEPAAQEAAPNEHMEALRAIASGAKDGQGLNGLYADIAGAVNALHAAGQLEGEAVDLANAAITHWAELELQING